MRRLAIFISHPIQYQSPLFQKLARQVDLTVFYYSKHGVEKSFDPQFGKVFKWDIPLLNGYKFEFLKNHSLLPGFHFFGFVNLGIFRVIANNANNHSDCKKRFDAVLINSWSYLSDWFVVLAAILNNTTVFLRSENPLNQELLKSKWKIWLKKIILGKILFPRIKKFLYIGEENKKFYKFYGVADEKWIFTPYAVDNERFIRSNREYANAKTTNHFHLLKNKDENNKLFSAPKNDKSFFDFSASKQIYELKRELSINPDSVVILFVGKLIEKKRPMDLIKAYEILIQNPKPKTQNNVTLIIVGDGELRKEIEDYCKRFAIGNVHFVGFKNQTELPQYYGLADIFVLPSGIGETWGLVVNEAMCFGLPIIVSDLVGCGSDLVKPAENGYTFPVGDVKELVNRLEGLIANRESRIAFGEKSFEIIQNYNYEKDVDGILTAMS